MALDRAAVAGEAESYTALVDALAERRHELGLSQLELDQRLGLTLGQIGKWETLRRLPSAYFLSLWAQGLSARIVLEAELPNE